MEDGCIDSRQPRVADRRGVLLNIRPTQASEPWVQCEQGHASCEC